jgi:hypothetical protein
MTRGEASLVDRRRDGQTQRARDLELAQIAKRHGANYSLRIVQACRAAKVPVSAGFALIEVETGDERGGGRNIFGCDLGKRAGVPWCHQAVTRERVQVLIRHVKAGGTSNGVGPPQLTSLEYILRAERLGGAHLTRCTITVGMQVLREKTGGDMDQAWRFNGSRAYQAKFDKAMAKWHRRLTA